MENQHGPLLNLAYFCQGKSMEELGQTLLLTAMELENTRMKAQEELKMRDYQIFQIKDMLQKIIKQRDEAQEKYQRLLLEKIMIQQQSGPLISGISSMDFEDEQQPRKGIDSNNGFSSSDCDESIVSSPPIEAASQDFPLQIIPKKPLPEKGKLLQAVMKAGPLLHNLLLAGPLPQWRHPPPPLGTSEIPLPPVVLPSSPPPPSPPVLTIHMLHQETLFSPTSNIESCGRLDRKRVLNLDSDSFQSEAKYQRVVLQ